MGAAPFLFRGATHELQTALYALGAILLGVVGIAFHDFAMQWQAVPESIPRTPSRT